MKGNAPGKINAWQKLPSVFYKAAENSPYMKTAVECHSSLWLPHVKAKALDIGGT
jgi:hypothetical protein